MTTIEGIDSAGTANLAFLEELFAQYQHDPESLSADWRQYFDSLVNATSPTLVNGHSSGGQPASTNGQSQASGVECTTVIQPEGLSKRSIDQAREDQAQERNDLLEDDTMITPEGIATGHALAIAEGLVQLPDAPAGEEKPAPLPDEVRQSQGSDRFAFCRTG